MRILHVTSFYEPASAMGGLAMVTATLARAQAREGAAISVFTTTAGLGDRRPRPEGEDRGGVRVHYFPVRAGSRFFFSGALLRACWTQIPGFDLVHVHGLWTFPATWAAAAARRARVPYVLSPHGSLNRWPMKYKAYKKIPYWWIVERHTVRGARRIHCATQDEAAQARPWIGDRPTAVIPLAVEAPLPPDASQAAAWRMRVGVPPGVPVIGFLGRIHPIKGLDLLVDAVARVEGAHLILAGPDDGDTHARLARQAAALGIAERVHWPGLLDAAGRGALLAAIDVFVLPSHSESFGLAAAEAMAAGVAVVMTPGVNLAGMAGSAAGCVVPRDPEKMADALSGLLSDRARRTALGTAARRLVAERLSPAAVARQMLRLYEECVAPARDSATGRS
jgi:glycosyltransferase involved in cell wall biosynthesis